MATKAERAKRLKTEKEFQRRELLKAVMRRADLVPEDVASVLARDRVTVYRWLNGSRPVPAAVERWLLSVAPQVIEASKRKPKGGS